MGQLTRVFLARVTTKEQLRGQQRGKFILNLSGKYSQDLANRNLDLANVGTLLDSHFRVHVPRKVFFFFFFFFFFFLIIRRSPHLILFLN